MTLNPEFPGKIGRKVNLVMASGFALVLLVGGVTILLARSILGSTEAIREESEAIKAIDRIHFTAHHLVDATSYAVIRGTPYPGEDVQGISSNLGGQVEAYLKARPKGEVTAAEQGIFRDLEAMASTLGRLSQGIFGSVAQGAKAGSGDLETLMELIYRIHARAEQLTGIHQARIQHLIRRGGERMRFILTLYLAFVVIGTLLIAVGNATFARAIVAPIRTLAAATEEVASGRFEKRVPVASRDEIGRLSFCFNVMAERLAEHEQELRSLNEQLERKAREREALYRIGTEILGSLDLDRILHSVVEKAKALLGCEVGALCLLEEEGQKPVLRVTSGPPLAFALGGGQGGRADLMGLCSPDKAEACLEGQVCPCTVVRSEYREAHLAVPLRRGGKVIGVFCVGDRRPRTFSAAEVDLLSGLAAQAAIAIENARLYQKAESLAILEERERIAREMHDGLAQVLGALHLQLSRAQELLKAGETARVGGTLEEIRRMAEGAYEDVRQAIFGLRTMVSRGLGLIPTLTEYLHEWSVQSGVAADLQIRDEKATRLAPEVELQLIRIIQEALANVRKHAMARSVSVRFEREGDHALVTVSDDGRGFEISKLPKRISRGFGLTTMRERAESAGGSLEVHSEPGRGTSILVRLPFPGEGRS